TRLQPLPTMIMKRCRIARQLYCLAMCRDSSPCWRCSREKAFAKSAKASRDDPMISMKQRGFSLLELLITVALGFTMAAVTFMAMKPLMNRSHVDSAYETTLMVLRNTRHLAITQGHEYIVTFNPGGYPAGTIEVQYQPPPPVGSTTYPVLQLVNTYTIPT